MKKWIAFCLCLIFLLPLGLRAHAAPPKIVDDANLLSDSEEAALEEKAQALAAKYQMDVVIVTVWSLDGKSSEAYADDYFDYNGYGIGSDYSGVLFLLSMEYRDWAISTCGDTIYALTDYGIQSVFSDIAGYLSDDQYYRAFNAYLDGLDPYFQAYAQGDPIDGKPGDYDGPGSYEPGTQEDVVHYPQKKDFLSELPGKLLIGLLIGLAAAGITLLILRGQMRTAKPQSGAKVYMCPGSYDLRQQQDVFLYSRIRKVRRSESSGGGGSHGGGGSSVHHSSSGRSHGGGHGKF